MGIKLDWQVESEHTQLQAAEDPEVQRRRRRERRRLLLIVLLLACTLSLIASVIIWRLNTVEAQYEQDLRDTVAAEIAAIKADNIKNFNAIQRSHSETFKLEQKLTFQEYQDLKQANNIELTGEILDLAIDDQRARVIVKEIKDDVEQQVVWFYWYYRDAGEEKEAQYGWRRVPDDLTFWGEARELKGEGVRITYNALDEKFAQALLPHLEAWWQRGCALAACPTPTLHVDIVAARPPAVEWQPHDLWTLTITSPYVSRTPIDAPLSADREREIVHQIAARLVRYVGGDTAPVYYSDAVWLYAELERWLAATLLAGGGVPVVDAGFIGSLVEAYGGDAPPAMLHAIQANSTLDDALFAVTGVPLAQLSVDQISRWNWANFFAWRLALESQLVQPDTSGAFLSLYDMANPDTVVTARLNQENVYYASRYSEGANVQIGVITIYRDEYPDGPETFARVEVARTENGTPINEVIRWRLTGGSWKRVN